MNLVEALREIGPARGDAAVVELRVRAAELVHAELRHLAEHSWQRIGEADREDAASQVMLRLINNGPRGDRAGDPTTPDGVRAFLRAAFGNGVRDMLRRQRKWVEMGEGFEVADVRRGPSEEAARREEHREKIAAEGVLFGEIVPRLGERSRNGAALLTAVEQLRQVHDGRTTVATLVSAECGGDSDPLAVRKGRNRLDQRFSRAFARIHAEVDAWLVEGRLGVEAADRMRLILDGLRLRQ
jgi:hypothetical protein